MSTEHHDDEHAMINEGETPEELEYAEDDGAEQARLAEEKARKDKKLKAVLFGGLAAAAVVFVGVKLAFPTAKPSANTAVVSPMVTPAPVVPLAAPTAPAVVAPVPAPAGMPAPSVQSPVASNADVPMPAGTNAPAPAPAPAPAVPGLAAPASVAVAPSASVVDPLRAPVDTPAVVAVAGMSDPKAVEGFSRGMDELTKKLDELKAMFTKFDEMQIGDRLAKLEARVGALEGRSSSAKPSTSSEGQAQVARHRAHAPAARTAKVVPIGEGEEMLFSRMVDARQSVSVTAPLVTSAPQVRQAAQAEVRGYVLHAVIPGRIWVKNADGNSQTFESGEVLPDGAKILKIDPDRGDVVTSKGVLKFDAR